MTRHFWIYPPTTDIATIHTFAIDPKFNLVTSQTRNFSAGIDDQDQAAGLSQHLPKRERGGGAGSTSSVAVPEGLLSRAAAIEIAGTTVAVTVVSRLIVQSFRRTGASMELHQARARRPTAARVDFDTPEFARLKPPGAPATCHGNSSCTRPRPTERPFSGPTDLARRLRRMREYERRFELSS